MDRRELVINQVYGVSSHSDWRTRGVEHFAQVLDNTRPWIRSSGQSGQSCRVPEEQFYDLSGGASISEKIARPAMEHEVQHGVLVRTFDPETKTYGSVAVIMLSHLVGTVEGVDHETRFVRERKAAEAREALLASERLSDLSNRSALHGIESLQIDDDQVTMTTEDLKRLLDKIND